VASANIGCSLQIRRHLEEGERQITVAHPIELLDRSYAAGAQAQ
jgi:glycolate oxidase iron-sulfur subunit